MIGDCELCALPTGFTNPDRRPQHPGCKAPGTPPLTMVGWWAPTEEAHRLGIKFDPAVFPQSKGVK